MDKYFRLEFKRGGIFKAKLLKSVAPKTCQVIYDALPFSSTVLHSSFCGFVLYLRESFELSEIENPVVFGAQPGDIFLNTNANKSVFEGKILPPQIYIACGPGVILWNWAGWLPSNYFAKIVEDDLEELSRVGRRIRWEGKEDIVCSLI